MLELASDCASVEGFSSAVGVGLSCIGVQEISIVKLANKRKLIVLFVIKYRIELG